ncbi:MAG: hypothetical protein C0405_14150, partial [Desulfovibrio sp.]|nr:hypothetical protein [Desulfovibrio sp.]
LSPPVIFRLPVTGGDKPRPYEESSMVDLKFVSLREPQRLGRRKEPLDPHMGAQALGAQALG